MTTTQINNALFRKLKNGIAYNKYFPNSSCSITKLATGNTEVAINKMAMWATKYANQCKLIAPVLTGKTLGETLNNIHKFLYWHIQYKIDGTNQNLKSPACAWDTRKEGTDCKSYSIFASCILLNLGVKHYLRRIRQPNIMQDAFTHVYVVIPKNQKTGSLTNGYHIIDATINNNNEIPFLIKDDIYMEPNLPIYGLAAPTLQHNNGFNYPGYEDYHGLSVPVPVAGAVVKGQFFKKALKFIIGGDFINKTFGSIFANGFDLSCWNSASNPSKQEQIIVQITKAIQQKVSQINNDNIESALNELSRHITYEWQSFQHSLDRRDWAGCTKKAWRLHIKAFQEMQVSVIDQLVSNLQADGWKVSKKNTSVPEQSLEDLYRNNIPKSNTTAEKNGQITYTVYSLTAPKNPVDIIVDTNGNIKTPQPTQAGFGGVGMLLLGGVILGGIVYGTKKLNPKK